MDLAMAGFLFSAWYAEVLAHHATGSIFALFNAVTEAFVPYAIGKLLLEPQRDRLVKRFVLLLFFACILSAWEYRMGSNPFMRTLSPFFPGESFAWKTQFRWGFGRVSGPFGQSELAGMMLFTGIALTLYLNHARLWEPKFRSFAWLPWSKSAWINATLILTLIMTQARGPWLGCLAAIPIALVGRSKHVLRQAILTGVVLVTVGSIAFFAVKHYTSGPVASDEQQTAAYRAELLTNYLPVALHGGAFGWGSQFPQIAGQGSIDNEYLFVALTQGWVGLLSFCLLALLGLWNLARGAILNRDKQDRYFAFTLLGILVGLLVTIYTVFLGNQPYQLFFLILGWAQAVRRPTLRSLSQAEQPAQKPRFAFAQIYT
jgi:hypothetical protein